MSAVEEYNATRPQVTNWWMENGTITNGASSRPLIPKALADAMRDELLAEVERLKTGHCEDCCCAQSWKALSVHEFDGKSIPEHISDLKQRAEAAEAKLAIANDELRLGSDEIEDAQEQRDEARRERDRLAWMLERIRDSEYDRMSDADALADLAARYDARHEEE